jgi:hypothetical protein
MTGSVGHQAQPQEREVERLVGAQEGSVHAFMFPAELRGAFCSGLVVKDAMVSLPLDEIQAEFEMRAVSCASGIDY